RTSAPAGTRSPRAVRRSTRATARAAAPQALPAATAPDPAGNRAPPLNRMAPTAPRAEAAPLVPPGGAALAQTRRPPVRCRVRHIGANPCAPVWRLAVLEAERSPEL